MKQIKLYLKLFISTFYLSAFTFGGGYVIVPLMRKKFVDELKWINEEEMLDMIAIAQSSPGALAVNAAIIIGYRIAGIVGAIITTIGTILPPLILITIIAMAYERFIEIKWIATMLYGMKAAVAAIVCDVVWKMAKDIKKKQGKFYVVMMLLAFITNILFDFHLFLIIIVCGMIGLFYETRKEEI